MDLKHREMRTCVCTKPKQKKRNKFEEREWTWNIEEWEENEETAWNAKEREFASGKLKKENLHLGN